MRKKYDSNADLAEAIRKKVDGRSKDIVCGFIKYKMPDMSLYNSMRSYGFSEDFTTEVICSVARSHYSKSITEKKGYSLAVDRLKMIMEYKVPSEKIKDRRWFTASVSERYIRNRLSEMPSGRRLDRRGRIPITVVESRVNDMSDEMYDIYKDAVGIEDEGDSDEAEI